MTLNYLKRSNAYKIPEAKTYRKLRNIRLMLVLLALLLHHIHVLVAQTSCRQIVKLERLVAQLMQHREKYAIKLGTRHSIAMEHIK